MGGSLARIYRSLVPRAVGDLDRYSSRSLFFPAPHPRVHLASSLSLREIWVATISIDKGSDIAPMPPTVDSPRKCDGYRDFLGWVFSFTISMNSLVSY